MKTIVGISGSLRKGSYNSILLRNAIEFAPASIQIEAASIEQVPLYNADHEQESGMPQSVIELKARVAKADAVLLVTPEYNNGIPGVMKNAIDWMSRPGPDASNVFANKIVGLIGATPGISGTRFAQTAWLSVFRTLGVRPWFGRQLYLDHVKKILDDKGQIVDAATKELLVKYLEGFATFIG
jgi:chromate reductase